MRGGRNTDIGDVSDDQENVYASQDVEPLTIVRGQKGKYARITSMLRLLNSRFGRDVLLLILERAFLVNRTPSYLGTDSSVQGQVADLKTGSAVPVLRYQRRRSAGPRLGSEPSSAGSGSLRLLCEKV